MNFQKILNVLQLIKNYQEIVDTFRLEKYYKTNYKNINNNINEENIENNENRNKKIIIFRSKVIHKMELSIELLYKIFYKEEKNKRLGKNIFFNLIFELIKCGFKMKELKSLNEIGIPFYIEENIFYNDFLGIDKSKYIKGEEVNGLNFKQIVKLNEKGFIEPLYYKDLVLIERELKKKKEEL
jgi:hypothetical protein